MPLFQITSVRSGVVLGHYEAADEQGALDAMARGAGYCDEKQARRVGGEIAPHVRVCELERRDRM